LLQYYSPVKVAEAFLVLEALFPGRIDLGVCRGPGLQSPDLARALVNGHDDELLPEAFDRKVAALAGLLRTAARPAPEDDVVRVHPLGVRPPPLWVLGAGPTSARLAASLGSRYGYSLFFGGGLTDGVGLMAEYRHGNKSCIPGETENAVIAVSVICAEDAGRAREYDAELVAQGCFKSNIVGTPKQCARTLISFAELFEIDEILVATFLGKRSARWDLYRRLAEELRIMS
jgi:alkanesulfonate monooxygenase SsuD/methylene tetrahydromethanopterin reductase-like flavin-dependent oxidoreductase (luciferase family)